jgi:hypothetical protein
MKKRLVMILAAGTVLLHSGCKKFSEFQTDPNKSTIATPNLLLNTVEQKAFQSTSLNIAVATRQMGITESASNYQYYGWTRSDYGDFDNLLQVLKMEQAATAQGKPEYIPLVKFFKAWYFLRLTQTFGDIPYSDALKGEENISSPSYDKQEDIYLNILNDLKAANELISSNTVSVQGDIVYNGNMVQWKRAINSLSLRVLISLSIKENDSRLEIRKRFADIVNNPAQYPIFTGNTDNSQLKFYDLQDNRYPYFNDNAVQTAYYMDESFVNMLKGLRDPRLFSFADKAPKFAALPATDFNAYAGIQGSAPVNENAIRQVNGEASRINPRFYNSPVNESSIALGYAEQQFILAEGVTRGWINGNASEYYQKGISASMSFYSIDQAAITAYLAQNTVQLGAAALQQIITQKYISSFMNSGWQPFFEQRRTGFPVFEVAGSGVLNNKMIPKRWMYPEAELQVNQRHVTEAISRQFPEGDNINGTMWLLKP